MAQYDLQDADDAAEDGEEEELPLLQKVAIVMVALGKRPQGR